VLLALVASLGLAAGGALLTDWWLRPPAPGTRGWGGGPGPGARRERPLAGRVGDFLARAGLRDVTVRDFVAVSAGIGLAAGLAAQVLVGWAVVTLAAAGAGALAPALYYGRREAGRRAAVQEALATAMDRLRDAQSAGIPIQSACRGLAETGPAVLRPEFARLVREEALVGFPAALAASQARLAEPVWDTAALALLVNHRLGSRHVGPLLARLATATRAELRVRAELRAQQAQHVTAARLVAGLPFLVLLALRWLNPEYVAVFGTAGGQAVLAGCALAALAGYAVMLRVATVPADERVLAPLGAAAPTRTAPAVPAAPAAPPALSPQQAAVAVTESPDRVARPAPAARAVRP
jgi:tight adherence protein B